MKTKAYKSICIILAVLFVASAAVGIFLYRELCNEREARAETNIFNWSRLHGVGINAQQVNDIDHAGDFYHLQNGIVYSLCGNVLSPDFDNLDAPTTEEYFLTIHFNDFVHMLSIAEETDPDLEQRFALLHEMGKELEEISSKALKHGEKGKAQKNELMDEGSEIYKELKADISEFCNTYVAEIKKYN